MRRDSWRSVPSTYRPPALRTRSAYFSERLRMRLISASQAASYSSGVSTGSSPRARRLMSARMSGLPPSTMSVPRPAMLVATVTAPGRPAWATISASCSWCFALSTWCFTPRRCRSWERYSERSTEVVPTSTGWFLATRSTISSTTAANLASWVLYTRSVRSSRWLGRLVGIVTTSSL